MNLSDIPSLDISLANQNRKTCGVMCNPVFLFARLNAFRKAVSPTCQSRLSAESSSRFSKKRRRYSKASVLKQEHQEFLVEAFWCAFFGIMVLFSKSKSSIVRLSNSLRLSPDDAASRKNTLSRSSSKVPKNRFKSSLLGTVLGV